MHNVTHTVTGDVLTITVKIGKDHIKAAPPSTSGKTKLVGTTSGAVAVECPHASMTYSLNVMAK